MTLSQSIHLAIHGQDALRLVLERRQRKVEGQYGEGKFLVICKIILVNI